MTLLYAFSNAWRRLHVFALSSDWFIGKFEFAVIGQGNYFGFGFKTIENRSKTEKRTIIFYNVIVYIIKSNLKMRYYSRRMILLYIKYNAAFVFTALSRPTGGLVTNFIRIRCVNAIKTYPTTLFARVAQFIVPGPFQRERGQT